jgi:integrase
MPKQKTLECPRLSQAIKTVYNRRKRGTPDGDFYLMKMAHNVKAIGNLPIDQITEPLINILIDFHRENYGNSNKTINKKVSALKITLEEMASDGHIKMISFPKRLKESKGRIHFLTEEMEEELLHFLLEKEYYIHYDFIKCLIDLGPRLGELLGLEKRDIDYKTNQITFPERKCDNPVSVPMSDKVNEILKPYHDKCKQTERLFPYESHWLRKVWNEARDTLGFKGSDWYVPHICRHTCATRLVQRGVPLGVVKDWMGHESIQATMIYAHHAPKQLHEAVKVLNTWGN